MGQVGQAGLLVGRPSPAHGKHWGPAIPRVDLSPLYHVLLCARLPHHQLPTPTHSSFHLAFPVSDRLMIHVRLPQYLRKPVGV